MWLSWPKTTFLCKLIGCKAQKGAGWTINGILSGSTLFSEVPVNWDSEWKGLTLSVRPLDIYQLIYYMNLEYYNKILFKPIL